MGIWVAPARELCRVISSPKAACRDFAMYLSATIAFVLCIDFFKPLGLDVVVSWTA
jgi:hypothetical protein